MADNSLPLLPADTIRRDLLAWYHRDRRDLPWRRTRDPYAIWVSEIMLQQTRVAVVIERFLAFIAHFPNVIALARASEQEVLALWSGLGYYRRARMLHQAAQVVADQRLGKLPRTAAELRALSGIGSYTSAAIASIAFGEPVAVVDGNVERVLCRLAGWHATAGENTALRRRIEALAVFLLDPSAPGDFNQAMMELGATICAPRNPQCLVCPVSCACATRGEHKTLPHAPMTAREAGCALCLRTKKRSRPLLTQILLEQRPASLTVMPDLWELPALLNARVPEDRVQLTVRHAIMQVNYTVRVREVEEPQVDRLTVAGGKRRWVSLPEASAMALTGLARKILRRAHLLEPPPPAAV